VAAGAAVAFSQTLLTWGLAVRALDDLTERFSALQIQAVTGLLAIAVLLVVMNWFFHKVYWTGWIALHTSRKQALLDGAAGRTVSTRRLLLGLGLLGFTSLYREGVEVVLFLQSYRLKLGPEPVAMGVSLGLTLTAMVAVITFRLRHRLPYRKMLVVTGVLLGVVLLVMVGSRRRKCSWRTGSGRPRFPGSPVCPRGWSSGSLFRRWNAHRAGGRRGNDPRVLLHGAAPPGAWNRWAITPSVDARPPVPIARR
jgi:hypothetical protein